MFFKMITLENGFKLSDNTKYRYFNTSMDYLQKVISRFNFREGREQKREIIPFMDIVKEPPRYVRQGHYYSQRDKIIETIRQAREERKRLFCDYDTMTAEEKRNVWKMAGDIKQDCIEEVEKLSTSPAVLYLTLKELDNKADADVTRFVFEVLFGRPDEVFYQMLLDSQEPIDELVEDPAGNIRYYDFNFKKVPHMPRIDGGN